MLANSLSIVGTQTVRALELLGRLGIFLGTTLKILCTKKLQVTKIFGQIERIGIGSLLITIITGACSGAVFALQSYEGFKCFGGEELIGPIVALCMSRELGPILTGLMVAGRAGSAMAAEIGTMRVTEQIDALISLQISPYQYLIVPRIVAATLILPFLTLFAVAFGILGGYIVCTLKLGTNGEVFKSGIKEMVCMWDLIAGLIKSVFFGLIIATVSSYQGFYTYGGARGVGIATTKSVVISSILIIISNYFLAILLFA